jgi:Carboxypeptidase regulatory-like domain/TonB-dependent Receptor Plug Domain
MSLIVVLLLSSADPGWAQSIQTGLSGVVTDQTGGALPGATVVVRTLDGAVVSSTAAGSDGRYRLDAVTPGRYAVEFQLPNFAMLRREVTIAGGEAAEVNASLRLSLSADVAVTGKRTFRNIADLERPEGGLIGVADAASEGLVTGQQIDARPIMRAGEVLETVPGLIISQHSGEGKANQYYLRGFNLDHGTDFTTSVAGVPVNMPTHAHGHGYSDLNFLIPELVSGVQFRKGPYFAEEGDFATAGAAHIRYVNALDRPILRVSGGEDGWGRVLAAASPLAGEGRLLVATELNHNDGPWARGDDYERLNGVIRYSVGDTLNGWSLTAMGYDGSWQSTDQAPRRAIDAGVLPRFSGVDDTTGGNTTRISLSGDGQRTTSQGLTRASAYVMKYELDLFSNFTYFLDDAENGDQFQQSDRRVVSGGRLSHRILSRIKGRPSELLVGADLRHDAIGRLALLHTVRREPLSVTRADQVSQTSVSGYVQQEVQWTPWMRSSAGLRLDRFQFDVEAGTPENSGTAGMGLASPKASLIFGPWRTTEMYVNAGYGYHSNDARGTTITVNPATGEPADRVTPLARARGAEVGARIVPTRGLEMDVALWRLDLDQELLFIGDAGATAPSRPSRRWGVEWNTYAAPRPWLTFDADLAWSHARFTDANPAAPRIPGAVERVASAGVTLDSGRVAFGSLRLRYFGPRNLVGDGSVRSSSTRLLNGQIGARLSSRTDLVVDAFNLLDAEASDIDYFYASRLPGEAADGVEDVHTHPTLPRTLRLSMRLRF